VHLFNSLKQRSFALLWSGQSVSRLGDALYRIGLSWWVLEETGSAAIMGTVLTVLIFSFVPMLLFVLIGGITVDRFSRIRLMITSDLLRGLVVMLAAFLAFQGSLQVWHFFALSIIFGFVEAFFQPAYTALMPVIVPAEDLPSANSLKNLGLQLAGIIGPVLGATLISLGGTSLVFLLDGLSFFFSAALLVPLLKKVSEKHFKSVKRINAWQNLRDGLKIVRDIPWIWVTIALFSVANIFLSGPNNVALPFYVSDVLGRDVNVLGWPDLRRVHWRPAGHHLPGTPQAPPPARLAGLWGLPAHRIDVCLPGVIPAGDTRHPVCICQWCSPGLSGPGLGHLPAGDGAQR